MKLKRTKKNKPPKIIECTEAELFMFWWNNWRVYDWYEFKKSCIQSGTNILKEKES